MNESRRNLEAWCQLWGARELAPEISLEVSTRMTRSLGRCYPDRKLIRIARLVVEESEDLFREVLCHEAAHLAAYHLHGTSIRPHGREWKALMVMAGYEPAVRFKVAPRQTEAATATRGRPLMSSILALLTSRPLGRPRVAAFKAKMSKRG